MVKSTSTTQAVIALSSAESEFYAGVKAASISLGLRALVRDMGVAVDAPTKVKMDASAGLGITHRRGAGRIRHIHTPALWIKRAHQVGHVLAEKLDGKDNVADLGTKHVEAPVLQKLMPRCGFFTSWRGGPR